MKKIMLMIAVFAISVFAFCETGYRQSIYWNGGHQEAIYSFGSGNSLRLSCGTSNAYDNCPFNIKYDFWAGKFCN